MVKRKAVTSKKSRLDRIREKLSKMSFGGGEYWKPKQGTNQIRILPEVGEMEFFWLDIGQHFTPDNRMFFCPAFTFGESCPICEFVDTLYKAGDKDSKTMAKELRLQGKYWMNIIDRANEAAGPQVFAAGPMIFRQISSLLGDPDYGEAVFDPEDGVDLTIKRSGDGLGTRYEVIPKRKATSLSRDDDTFDDWLDNAKDLTPFELSDDPEEDAEAKNAIIQVLPYDRLKDAFEGLGASGDEEEEEEELPFPDGEDEEDELDKAIRRRRAGRTRRNNPRRSRGPKAF